VQRRERPLVLSLSNDGHKRWCAMQGVAPSNLYHVSRSHLPLPSGMMRIRMAPPMPQFPMLEVWQTMDESEQDALIDRIESARRRRRVGLRALAGLFCAGLALTLYLALA
jgi:hypothetical protein